MPLSAPVSNENSVFLNVPQDKGYEKLFVAHVAALVSLGRKPRSALEVTEGGQGRLDRIFALLDGCAVSIHDLSRVGVPARFNMPFELGLAYAKRRHHIDHVILIMERKQHRLAITLSDVPVRDVLIHDGTPFKIIVKILGALTKCGSEPDAHEIHELWKDLWKTTESLKTKDREHDIYHRGIFLKLVEAAMQLAAKRDLIKY